MEELNVTVASLNGALGLAKASDPVLANCEVVLFVDPADKNRKPRVLVHGANSDEVTDRIAAVKASIQKLHELRALRALPIAGVVDIQRAKIA